VGSKVQHSSQMSRNIGSARVSEETAYVMNMYFATSFDV